MKNNRRVAKSYPTKGNITGMRRVVGLINVIAYEFNVMVGKRLIDKKQENVIASKFEIHPMIVKFIFYNIEKECYFTYNYYYDTLARLSSNSLLLTTEIERLSEKVISEFNVAERNSNKEIIEEIL